MSEVSHPLSLSVIIPTYNRSDFVRACVGSLQRCGVEDLEIIVVDDGSTENVEAVVRSFSGNVIYLRQANAGPAAARNNGFTHSRGRYIACLDSDDEWLPGVAPALLRRLDQYPEIDVVFTEARMGNRQEGFRSWIEMAGQQAFFDLPHREPEPGLRVLEPKPFFRRMAERNPVFIGALIMRRRAFAAAGLFDTELCGAADWELWLRMASRFTFAYSSEPLAIYTRHLECMSNNEDVMHGEFCMALRKIRDGKVAPGTAEHDWIEQRLRHHLFGHAYMAYNRGDYSLARQRFATLLRDSGLEGRGFAYWLLCGLPFGLAGRLRRWKHGFAG